MIQPTIDHLLTKADSKYSLAVVAAKRARRIVDGEERLTKADTEKPVSLALCEIGEGKISYEFKHKLQS